MNREKEKFDRKKRIRKRVLWYVYLILLVFPCLELALWVVGGRPYTQEDYHISVNPKNAFIGDSKMGIALNPGTYDIELNHQLNFQTTHLENGQRKVCFQPSYPTDTVLMLGCSFTYGYGVNDHENFSSLLQKSNPNLSFNNLGVIGYGSVQSYLQLEQLIKTGQSPKLVYLNFSSFHLDRNAMTPEFKRAMGIGFKQSLEQSNQLMEDSHFPYCSSTQNFKIDYIPWSKMYSDWWGREYFASINWLQTQLEIYERYKMNVIGTSYQVLKEMKDLCHKNNIDFVLVHLNSTEESSELMQMLKQDGMEILEVGFDFEDPSITNLPVDSHPNAKGHQKIANSIQQHLNQYFD